MAFTAKKIAGRWGIVAWFTAAVVFLSIWPPINQPGDKNPIAFSEYYLAAFGGLMGVFYLVLLACGFDSNGRTAREIIVRARVMRWERRRKKLQRIEKLCLSKAAESGEEPRSVSKLGFQTQVDPLAQWVRTWEARSIGSFTGISGSGLSAEAYKSLAKSGDPAPRFRDFRA